MMQTHCRGLFTRHGYRRHRPLRVKSCRACEKLENAARVRCVFASLSLSLCRSFPPALLNAKPRHNSFPNRCGVARSRALPDILILSIRQPFSPLATPRRVDARSYVQLDPSLSLSLSLSRICRLLLSPFDSSAVCCGFFNGTRRRVDVSTPAFPSLMDFLDALMRGEGTTARVSLASREFRLVEIVYVLFLASSLSRTDFRFDASTISSARSLRNDLESGNTLSSARSTWTDVYVTDKKYRALVHNFTAMSHTAAASLRSSSRASCRLIRGEPLSWLMAVRARRLLGVFLW